LPHLILPFHPIVSISCLCLVVPPYFHSHYSLFDLQSFSLLNSVESNFPYRNRINAPELHVMKFRKRTGLRPISSRLALPLQIHYPQDFRVVHARPSPKGSEDLLSVSNRKNKKVSHSEFEAYENLPSADQALWVSNASSSPLLQLNRV